MHDDCTRTTRCCHDPNHAKNKIQISAVHLLTIANSSDKPKGNNQPITMSNSLGSKSEDEIYDRFKQNIVKKLNDDLDGKKKITIAQNKLQTFRDAIGDAAKARAVFWRGHWDCIYSEGMQKIVFDILRQLPQPKKKAKYPKKMKKIEALIKNTTVKKDLEKEVKKIIVDMGNDDQALKNDILEQYTCTLLVLPDHLYKKILKYGRTGVMVENEVGDEVKSKLGKQKMKGSRAKDEKDGTLKVKTAKEAQKEHIRKSKKEYFSDPKVMEVMYYVRMRKRVLKNQGEIKFKGEVVTDVEKLNLKLEKMLKMKGPKDFPSDKAISLAGGNEDCVNAVIAFLHDNKII